MTVQSHANSAGSRRPRPNQATLLTEKFWLLTIAVFLAAAPVVHVVLGLAYDGQFIGFYSIVRKNWWPTIIMECCLIVMAFVRGFSLMDFWRRLPPLARMGLGLWLSSIMIATLLAPYSLAIGVSNGSIWLIHILFGASLWHMINTHRPTPSAFFFAVLSRNIPVFAAITASFIFLFVVLKDPESHDLVKMTPGFSHLRHWGQFALPALSILAVWLLHKENQRHLTLQYMLYCGLVAFIFWSGHRGIIVSHVMTLLLLPAIFPALRNPLKIVIQIAAFGSSAAVSLLLTRPDHHAYHALGRLFSPQSSVRNYSSGRTEFWQEAVEMIMARPWGYGGGQYRYISEMAQGYYNHPHNVVLQTAIDWGVLATCALIVLLFAITARIWRARHAKGPAMIAAASLFIGTLFWACIDGALYYPVLISYFICACVFICADTSYHINRRTSSPL